MSIKITENGVVRYENSPDVNRKLFPNLNICGKEIDKLEEEINGKAPAVFSTTSGSIASFDNGADDMPMKSCVVSIEPIQEGSGDPSPENVRLISGRTGVTVSHSGSDTSDPTTISVNWQTEAGTMYGGTFDVVSGKLTVDRAKVVANTLTWSYQSENNRFYAAVPGIVTGKYAVRCVPLKCSKALCIDDGRTIGNVPYNSIYGAGTSTTVYIKTEINNINDFMSTFGDAEIVFEVATPTEIQLTPQEVRTLLGENNIWSDGGDVEVIYPADTKTYIDAFSIKTVEVSGQTPTITAEENTRYICGEVTSLTFTPCASGICDIRFTAASISTVLTLPQTLKLPDWFDPTALEANTTYEINIVDGVYGAVMSWV